MELVHDRSRRTKTAEAEYSRLLSPTSQSSKRRSQTKTSKKQPTRDEMMYRREREKLTLSTSWHRYYYLPDQAREWEFTHTHKSSPVQFQGELPVMQEGGVCSQKGFSFFDKRSWSGKDVVSYCWFWNTNVKGRLVWRLAECGWVVVEVVWREVWNRVSVGGCHIDDDVNNE